MKLRSIYLALRDRSGFSLAEDFLQARTQPEDAVFIWIPKCAGTSLYRAIGARKRKTARAVTYRFFAKGIVTFGHMDYSELLRRGYVSASFDARAFKFAISRNPYDRAVSLYIYLRDKSSGKIPADQSFLCFLRSLYDNGCEPIGLYNSKGLSHCNPQVRWLENVDMDFVGRLENLAADLKSIAARLGREIIDIPHYNATERQDTRDYYCHESRQLVEWLYDEDFRVLGYDRQLE